MSRIIRHFTLAGITGLTIMLFPLILGTDNAVFILSMSTAYIGMVLIAATLLLGPLNIMRKQVNPVSSYLRRDIGIWAGLVSIAHVIFGLQRHFGGDILRYFFIESEQGLSIRTGAFGIASYTGLIATLICLALLVISNNASLKKLGAAQWKKMQRYNYLFFILVIVHGFAFQFAVNRALPYVLVVLFAFIIVISSQWKGYRLRESV